MSDFLKPLSFENISGIKYRAIDFIEDYFYISGKKAKVMPIKANSLNKAQYEAQLENNPQSLLKIFYTAIKIATYLTLALPAIFLLAKVIVRKSISIKIIEPIELFNIKTNLEFKHGSKDHILAFGDIHGELDGFKENLRKAKIIDNEGNFNKNFEGTIVQMGDVVDRGPKSVEAWEFLQKIQAQAKDNQVVRLLGNHEHLLLDNNFNFANYPNPEKLKATIKKDILDGKVKLAHFDGKRLYLHAGLRSNIREKIITDIKKAKYFWNRKESISKEEITNFLNQKLIECVKNDNYDHYIFQVGKSRGGSFNIGGVLWEDIKPMLNSARAKDIPQVFAHNPPHGGAPIRATEGLKLICVDAGLCKNYGNNNAFIKFKNGQLKVYEKIHNIWNKKNIEDPIALEA